MLAFVAPGYRDPLAYDQKRIASKSKWQAVGLIGVVVVIGLIASVVVDGPPTEETASAPSPPSARAAAPAPEVEDCFSPLDGNLDELENLVRPLLNNRGSMRTHSTRFSNNPDAAGYHSVVMVYSAENAFGGRITATARGLVHARTCNVRLVDPGF